MRKKIYILTLLILSLLFSCKYKPAPIIDNSEYVYKTVDFDKYIKNIKFPDEEKAKNNERFIVVKAGDNLHKIAKESNSDIKNLINRNNLTAPFILPVGKKLYIPIPNFHIVKKGESLFAIASKNNISIAKLAEKNNLKKPFIINSGQKLIVGKNIQISHRKDKPHIKARKIDKIHHKSIKKASFAWPTQGKIISSFGPKRGGLYNDGINIAAQKGSSVKSSQQGVVAYVGDELKGYGNLIIIKHSNKMITAYGHLNKSIVKRGDKVEKQQVIAYVGSSGNVNRSQLYFGLRKGKDPINPQKYLKN